MVSMMQRKVKYVNNSIPNKVSNKNQGNKIPQYIN